MSRSYRTTKETVLASRRLLKDKQGELVLPRVVTRKPIKGDIHPLDKGLVGKILRDVAPEYLYGLSRVELRPRAGEIGRPFGIYQRLDKTIVLYSIPTRWQLCSLTTRWEAWLAKYGAVVLRRDGIVTVTWCDTSAMACWFFSEVLAHELGHHYRQQYRTKRKGLGRIADEERVADLHASRITDTIIRHMREKRMRKSGSV